MYVMCNNPITCIKCLVCMIVLGTVPGIKAILFYDELLRVVCDV